MERFRTYLKSIKIFSDFFEKRLAYSEKMLKDKKAGEQNFTLEDFIV